MKVITFNKANECEKQEVISPEQIIYCGSIDNIPDEVLEKNGLNYSSFLIYSVMPKKMRTQCC